MPGLLADVNLQGHLPYLRRLIDQLGLLEVLADAHLALTTFPELGLDRHLNDRALWRFCQENNWVLLTDNRNHADEDSLEATLQDSRREGHLPVLTVANKGRFENSGEYASRVAEDIVYLLLDVFECGIRDRPRIFVPR
jgi:hypothetical protein